MKKIKSKVNFKDTRGKIVDLIEKKISMPLHLLHKKKGKLEEITIIKKLSNGIIY